MNNFSNKIILKKIYKNKSKIFKQTMKLKFILIFTFFAIFFKISAIEESISPILSKFDDDLYSEIDENSDIFENNISLSIFQDLMNTNDILEKNFNSTDYEEDSDNNTMKINKKLEPLNDFHFKEKKQNSGELLCNLKNFPNLNEIPISIKIQNELNENIIYSRKRECLV